MSLANSLRFHSLEAMVFNLIERSILIYNCSLFARSFFDTENKITMLSILNYGFKIYFSDYTYELLSEHHLEISCNA